MTLLILLCTATILHTLDKTHYLINALPTFSEKTKIDSSTPFTISYNKSSSGDLISYTNVFAQHLRNYVNAHSTEDYIYFDAVSKEKTFHVYIFEQNTLTPIYKKYDHDNREYYHNFDKLMQFLPCIEKNELSIWNSVIEFNPIEANSKPIPYKVVQWFAVLGSSNINEMRNLLFISQIKKTIAERKDQPLIFD